MHACAPGRHGLTRRQGFSEALDQLVAEQRAALPDFAPAAQAAELRAAYARWPDPASMVSAAVVVEHGGMPFGAGR